MPLPSGWGISTMVPLTKIVREGGEGRAKVTDIDTPPRQNFIFLQMTLWISLIKD